MSFFFSLQIRSAVTSASWAVTSSHLASGVDLQVWSLFGWREPRETSPCPTALRLIQRMELSLLSQHWVTGGAQCYGTRDFQRRCVSTEIQTKFQLSTKHSSLQPGQWMQQLHVCKNSESQRVFYFLHLETRQLHLIMKQQNLHIRQWHCSVFPGAQSPRHFHTRRIRALDLLLPPTFALPNRAIYRLYTPPPQLLFPPCETGLGPLDVQPHVNPVFL